MVSFVISLLLASEMVLLAATLFLLLNIGFIRLNSLHGIRNDGLPEGKKAPSWQQADITGTLRVSPSEIHWQILLFGDHSLVSFPLLIRGINRFQEEEKDVELMILARANNTSGITALSSLGLQAPVIQVDSAMYHRFRVRVMPFLIILDPQGIVQWRGLVNTDEHLQRAWQSQKEQIAATGRHWYAN
jgi:hypothetical protein